MEYYRHKEDSIPIVVDDAAGVDIIIFQFESCATC